MTYRQTFVIEYPDASHAPRVVADMEMLGGKLIACKFDDALEELEALYECCMPDGMSEEEKARLQFLAAQNSRNAYQDFTSWQLAQASQNWWAQCRGEVDLPAIKVPQKQKLWERIKRWIYA